MIPTSTIDRTRRALSPKSAVYTADSPEYDQKRAVVNRLFDKRPAIIVLCATDSDVAITVRVARDLGLPLSIRAGGCSPAGFSSNDGGVLLDLSLMQSFEINPKKMTVTVGAGVTLESAYDRVAASGLMFVGGVCKPVGVSGLTLGGGFSLLSRSLGMACDNLLSATVVTANGKVVTASRWRNRGLFWALRGAGNGNFGVVTSLTLKLHRLEPMLSTSITAWRLDEAAKVLTDGLAYFADGAPAELNAIWAFASDPKNGSYLLMIGVHNGPQADGDAAMSHLMSLGKPFSTDPKPRAYAELLNRAFPAPVDQIHDYFRSGFVTKALPLRAAELLAERFKGIPQNGEAQRNMIFFELAGGAINRVGADETAFVHRNHTVLLSLISTWQGPTGKGDPAEKRWNDELYKELKKYYSEEAYQNYPDRELPDWARAYYGNNLERLKAVKRQYDPDNVFKFAQSVPLPD